VTIDSFQTSMWFSSTVDTPLAQTFMQCVEGVLRTSPGPIGYLPGSDAKHLTGLARGEMVIFGPGSYEVAHAYDEYVDLGELAATARILIKFVNETILNG
jgi:acetylornithine deacetylase/succinyl-diaminopimelate desuccinylase-like protein